MEDSTPEHRPSAPQALARDPASRRRFLAAAGGAGGLSLVLAACGSSQQKKTPGGSNPNTGAGSGTDQFGKGDLGILAYTLTLEYLVEQFYGHAVHGGGLSGQALTLASAFGAQEKQHVATLEAAITGLGGKLPKKPVGQFAVTDQASTLKLAATLEGIAAGAYLGQLDRVQSKQALATLASIHTVEGRHAAALNALTGSDISPDGAFASPIAASDVLQEITPYVAVA